MGTPLADYMGDAVLDIDIVPNMARNANVLGVARELAALTGRKLRRPDLRYCRPRGHPIKSLVTIQIEESGAQSPLRAGADPRRAHRPQPV